MKYLLDLNVLLEAPLNLDETKIASKTWVAPIPGAQGDVIAHFGFPDVTVSRRWDRKNGNSAALLRRAATGCGLWRRLPSRV